MVHINFIYLTYHIILICFIFLNASIPTRTHDHDGFTLLILTVQLNCRDKKSTGKILCRFRPSTMRTKDRLRQKHQTTNEIQMHHNRTDVQFMSLFALFSSLGTAIFCWTQHSVAIAEAFRINLADGPLC